MIEEFLSTIWCNQKSSSWRNDLWGEIRTLGGPYPQQFWNKIGDLSDHLAYIHRMNDEGRDVYFGVVPRRKAGGTADDCERDVHVLWADVDAKHTGGKLAGLTGIRQYPRTPSIIVDSGHGYHCYWVLRTWVPFEDAQAAMKSIARDVKGDAVTDVARILRVPGTLNRKDPVAPVPVRVIYWDVERKYRIEDFPTIPETPTEADVWFAPHIPVGGTPLWLDDLIQQGAPRGSRSEACFKAVVWMGRYGWTDEQIEEAFRNSPAGIGEKYHEKGKDGPRWLRATIKAARRAA